MGVKRSRKGKKAWRRNISDELEVEAVKKANESAQVAGLKDSELFRLDKSGDDKMAATVMEGGKALPSFSHDVKKYSIRKAEKEKRKAEALEVFKQKKKKKRKLDEGPLLVREPEKLSKAKKGRTIADIWNEEVEGFNSDGWDVPKNYQDLHPGSSYRKQKLKQYQRSRKGLMVDKPGCSFNPDSNHHQKALAEAVAVEQAKVIAEAMRPKLAVPDESQGPLDELEMLLGEVDTEGLEENAIDNEDQEVVVHNSTSAEGRKTRTMRNKEMRVKKLEEEVAARQKNEKMLKQINNAAAIVKEIEKEEKLLENLRTRRKIDRERKLEVRPPRLGKAKYRPAPMQVLCSDEVSGSLRQLKPTVMLCKDVAKGIERVGAVEPRPDNYHPKRGPRGKEYLVGEHTEKMKGIVEEGRCLKESIRTLEKQVASMKPKVEDS